MQQFVSVFFNQSCRGLSLSYPRLKVHYHHRSSLLYVYEFVCMYILCMYLLPLSLNSILITLLLPYYPSQTTLFWWVECITLCYTMFLQMGIILYTCIFMCVYHFIYIYNMCIVYIQVYNIWYIQKFISYILHHPLWFQDPSNCSV